MESPEHPQTSTIQKISGATTVDPSQLQILVAIDQPVTLKFKFKWGKFKSLVSDISKPEEPLYIIKYKQFDYKSATTNNVIGTGALHVVNIDADYECRGRNDTLVA